MRVGCRRCHSPSLANETGCPWRRERRRVTPRGGRSNAHLEYHLNYNALLYIYRVGDDCASLHDEEVLTVCAQWRHWRLGSVRGNRSGRARTDRCRPRDQPHQAACRPARTGPPGRASNDHRLSSGEAGNLPPRFSQECTGERGTWRASRDEGGGSWASRSLSE